MKKSSNVSHEQGLKVQNTRFQKCTLKCFGERPKK